MSDCPGFGCGRRGLFLGSGSPDSVSPAGTFRWIAPEMALVGLAFALFRPLWWSGRSLSPAQLCVFLPRALSGLRSGVCPGTDLAHVWGRSWPPPDSARVSATLVSGCLCRLTPALPHIPTISLLVEDHLNLIKYNFICFLVYETYRLYHLYQIVFWCS